MNSNMSEELKARLEKCRDELDEVLRKNGCFVSWDNLKETLTVQHMTDGSQDDWIPWEGDDE